MTTDAMARGVRIRRWRNAIDNDVVLSDYRNGYIEAVSIRPGNPPAFIAAAEATGNGTWIVRLNEAIAHGIGHADLPDRAAAVTQLEVLCQQYHDRAIQTERTMLMMEARIQHWAAQG